jgi:hypothetical protein
MRGRIKIPTERMSEFKAWDGKEGEVYEASTDFYQVNVENMIFGTYAGSFFCPGEWLYIFPEPEFMNLFL